MQDGGPWGLGLRNTDIENWFCVSTTSNPITSEFQLWLPFVLLWHSRRWRGITKGATCQKDCMKQAKISILSCYYCLKEEKTILGLASCNCKFQAFKFYFSQVGWQRIQCTTKSFGKERTGQLSKGYHRKEWIMDTGSEVEWPSAASYRRTTSSCALGVNRTLTHWSNREGSAVKSLGCHLVRISAGRWWKGQAR